MICLFKRLQFDWYERRKELFPIRNYFYFTEIQFNWCHLLIYELKNFKFFVKRIYMIRLYLFSYICFDMTEVKQT